MHAGHPGGKGIAAQRSSHTRHLIGRNGHADSGATDKDAEGELTVGHCPAYSLGHVGIITGFSLTCPPVCHSNAPLLQVLNDSLLCLETSMVRTNYNLHSLLLFHCPLFYDPFHLCGDLIPCAAVNLQGLPKGILNILLYFILKILPLKTRSFSILPEQENLLSRGLPLPFRQKIKQRPAVTFRHK